MKKRLINLEKSNILNNDTMKRRKLEEVEIFDTNWFVCSLLKEYLTHFENLSNDIIYEIFEYLDYFHIYQSFFNLNKRFQRLLTYSNFPIKINILSISKLNFQSYYNNIIIPYQHRIISLCIKNKFCFQLDISPHRILSKFIRLEILILEHIDCEYIENVLKDIIYLPNLSSLIIIVDGFIKTPNQYLLQIFRLSTLKYCKISFENKSFNDLLPFATNEYSSIEQLVIKHESGFNDIHRLLSYVPKLRRLSFWCNGIDQIQQSISLNFVTHLFIKLVNINFNEFEQLIKNFFSNIKILHLQTNDVTFFNSNQWEKLILSFIPNLHIFNIQCNFTYFDLRKQFKSEFQLKQFISPFWIERQWYFAQQAYVEYHSSNTFYSTNPYRQKSYVLNKLLNEHTNLYYQEINLNSVHHVHIKHEEAINNCIYYFPNATKLTIENISMEKSNRFVHILKNLIPLKNLTKLEIIYDNYSFEKLIELLLLIPYIITLKINSIKFNRQDFLSIQNSENFQFVSKKNLIQNLFIKKIDTMHEVRLLFNVCSRLQHFTINEYHSNIDHIVRLLLSKSNNTTQHLFSICISIENERLVNNLKILIQSKELINDYILQYKNRQVHLWR